ncbi:MAG: trigger factor [Acholeplasmatales bacterium]|nr:trigger factor [Acholeplasmatales bacterium]
MVTEKLEHSRVKAIFDVTADEFEKALDKSFEINNAKVTLQGFRKGKAPRSVYEKHYGVESLYNEALNEILEAKEKEILADQKLVEEICGQFIPDIEGKLERGKDFKVSISFDVLPEVTLPEYKGIEVAKKVLTATDEEVEAAVKAVAAKDITKEVKAEQVIAKGDYATFDFVGKVDGKEFDGGKAENYELQIGSGQFIPGFEDQMIGMKSEETKDVNVTFPENYGAKNLAGKAAVFTVTVHEVKVEKLPEFTDEYVKGLNIKDVNTLAELKAFKKKELEDSKAVSEKDRQTNEIVNKILDATKVDMPVSLPEQRARQLKAQFEMQAKQYKIPFETYLSLMNITAEDFEKRINEQATRQALFDLVAAEIIEKENLVATEEQVNAKAEEIAKAQGKDAKAILGKQKEQLLNAITYDNFMKFILDNAKEI